MAIITEIDRRKTESQIFEDPITGRTLPKYKMPERSSSAKVIEELIKEELLLDGNARQNLCTFCTTWSEENVHRLMDICMDKNMIDKDEYPQTAEIEARCVHILADLWHSPDAHGTLGCSTTGSSEATMLGGLAMKQRWREKQKSQGKSWDKPNLVCGPVQICWHKFAKYFDVELREIPLDGEEVAMNPSKLKDYVDENTMGVVATLGVTYTCVYEPVAEIARELDRIQEETGWDVPIHVDGASGAFVAPFIHQDLKWDFQIPRVKSINASGHKFGLSPLGVGWIVWRSREDLPEELVFHVDYLGGNMPTFALNFSRPGGQIVAQYYNFIRLGFAGYQNIHQNCANTATWLADEIEKIGEFDLFYDGRGGLPAIGYCLKDSSAGYTLYDLSDCLRMRGWQIASYPLPSNRQDVIIQRIMIRQGVTKDIASLLLRDLNEAIAHLKAHPVSGPSSASGFNHN